MIRCIHGGCRVALWALAGVALMVTAIVVAGCTERPRGISIIATRTAAAVLDREPTPTLAFPTVVPHTPAPRPRPCPRPERSPPWLSRRSRGRCGQGRTLRMQH
ncbi:MAG: hypothetical protein HC884_05135 [Chloroflexaceae bacterium]|nr:hypothetical protein [Chloroflexaceae bacterium]